MKKKFFLLLALSLILTGLTTAAQTPDTAADLSKCRTFKLDMDGTDTPPMWLGTIWVDEAGDIVKCKTQSYKGRWGVPMRVGGEWKDFEMRNLTVDGHYDIAANTLRVNVYYQPTPSAEKQFLFSWDGENRYDPSGKLYESGVYVWVHEVKAPTATGSTKTTGKKRRR